MSDFIVIDGDDFILEIYNLDNALNIINDINSLIVSSDNDYIIINEINNIVKINENPVIAGGGGSTNSYFPSGW